MTTPIIELKNCTKRYWQGEHCVNALNAANLAVSAGEYLSIMGPSGSGKSTLLNMMGSLDQPTEGDVFIQGCSVLGYSDQELSIIRAQTIGFVFQQFHLISHLNVLENVLLPFQYRNIQEDQFQHAAEAALHTVGLEHRIFSSPKTLSGGEMQRVAIARAIAGNPALILADEPTGSLDQENALSIMSLLDELNQQGTALVVVTHDPTVAARATRQVICSGSWVKERSASCAD